MHYEDITSYSYAQSMLFTLNIRLLSFFTSGACCSCFFTSN